MRKENLVDEIEFTCLAHNMYAWNVWSLAHSAWL